MSNVSLHLWTCNICVYSINVFVMCIFQWRCISDKGIQLHVWREWGNLGLTKFPDVKGGGRVKKVTVFDVDITQKFFYFFLYPLFGRNGETTLWHCQPYHFYWFKFNSLVYGYRASVHTIFNGNFETAHFYTWS